MRCELCGEREATNRELVEGAEINVCDQCKSPGATRIEVPPEKKFTPKKLPELDLVPDFAERVQKGRRAINLGRGDLANRLGIKESLLGRIESGDFRPDEALARRIEKALKASLLEETSYAALPSQKEKKLTLGDVVELK